MTIALFFTSLALPPPLTLQFTTTLRAGQGYGHDGDGCVIAEAALRSAPVVQRLWFDAPNKRLAQTNPALRRPPVADGNLTVIGLFAIHPPTELDIRDGSTQGQRVCDTEPLPDAYCANGSRTCPPIFGDFGFGKLNALTSVLGCNYYNTTLLSRDPKHGTEVWQWSWVNPTRIVVNGTTKVYNITRNYTYTLATAAEARPDGTRPLLSFQWTQSIPLQPALPVHRDCFLFDYTENYVAGPIDASRWKPGVPCTNRSANHAHRRRPLLPTRSLHT